MTLISKAGTALQRRVWTKRAQSWDQGAGENPGLVRVVNEVLEKSQPQGGMVAVDLGSGSGQLSIPLAKTVKTVYAVDISAAMLDLLQKNATSQGLTNIESKVSPIEDLKLEPQSVDLVVSNYCLHHLADLDKEKIVQQSYSWLRPGGKLVIGDMMFGRGADSRDREIIKNKILQLAAKGPAGWWRIIKNVGRFVFRMQERPVSMAKWEAMLKQAGFSEVNTYPVVAEAGIIQGIKK